MYNMAHIELTNRCNLTCKMCKVQNGNSNMDIHQFQNILKQLTSLNQNGASIRNVELNGHGEALLHPRLQEAIVIAKRDFPHVSLVTNGTLLNEKVSQDLLLSGIDKITISITGSNISVYNNFQGYKSMEDSFLKVKDNIKRLISIKKELQSKADICLSYILTKDNKKDLWTYIKYWKKQGIDRIFVNPIIEHTSSRHYRRCYHIGNKIFISTNGNIFPCCYEFSKQLSIGNIWEAKNGIEDILYGSKQKELIETNKKCHFNKMPAPCQNCILMNRFPLIHSYRFRVRTIYNKGPLDFVQGKVFEVGMFLYSCLPNMPIIYQIMDKVKELWNPI